MNMVQVPEGTAVSTKFHFSALKSCFNILSSDVMSNTPFHLQYDA